MAKNVALDAEVIDQIDPYWRNIAALILQRAVGVNKTIVFDEQDLVEATKKMESQEHLVFVLGTKHTLEVGLVTKEEADRRVAEYNARKAQP